MNQLRMFFRRLRTLLWTALTLLTILAAVIVGIGKLLMPYSVHYQPELEAWLSKAFNQPVRVESFSGEWKAFGPRIALRGLTLMPEGLKSEIAINRAALDIKPLNALIPGRPLYSFRIIGADLSLVRQSDGRYVLSGLGVSASDSANEQNPGLRDVALNGEVRLQDISLSFDDPERGIHLLLGNVNGRLMADGRNISAEVQASIKDRDRQHIVGDLDTTVRLRLDSEQHLASAQWHVQTGELLLDELVRQLPHHPLVPVSGRVNAEVWGEWQKGEPQEMQGVLDLRDAKLSSQTGPMTIDHLNSRFNFRFTERKNWRFDMSDLEVEYAGDSWQTARFSVARNLSENYRLWISTDFLDLDFPLQLTQRIMASYNTKWPRAIPRRAQGHVSDFDLVLDSKWRLRMARGELDNGRFWGWEKGPDIEGVNAQFELDDGEGNVAFGGQSVKLDWLTTFRRPVIGAFSDCRVEVRWANKSDWGFDLNYCRFENKDISGFGRVRMGFGEGKPEVDINVAMEHGDISRFSDYWPENVMSKKTLHWLRASLLSGEVVNGRYSMFGDLDDFPFKNHAGRLQAIAPVKNADVSYADKWPNARQVDATAVFEDSGMQVTGMIGNTAGARVDRVDVAIGDFKQPVLDVAYRSSVPLPGLIKFIRNTPLLDNVQLDPDQFVFKGASDIDGRIHAVLGGSSEPMQVTGSLDLKGNTFTELVSGVQIDGITGKLDYSREGLTASALPAQYKGHPVSLDITSRWSEAEVFRAHLSGDLPVEDVIPETLYEREALFHRASGTSHWDVSLSAASREGETEREVWLEIYSGLEGVAIDLPAPMAKPETASWPLLVRYPVRTPEHTLTADLPGRAQLMMELSEDGAQPLRAAVELGGKVTELPGNGLFSVDGTTPNFDLDGWIDVTVGRFSDQDNPGGLSLNTARVDAGEVSVFDRQFDNVAMRMDYEDGVISGIFDGKDINGTVRYYKNEEGAHSMSGEFERLIMPDPVAEGMKMDTEPAELPEMHFYCKDFGYAGLQLGETRIEGYPVANGFHIESVEAQSPSFDFNARGDWTKGKDGERSDFNIRISSESLGAVLEAMDISSAMRGGQTLVHFDAWWDGPPAAFALEKLNGNMDISVVQGNILTANPGAGRVLGLLSLSELPRRLAMDFRDVFDEGFSFDEAKGTMKLENGTSSTDDLTLSSTVAQITITGSTDLVAKTFDYEFTVRPGVSKTLPVIGAIAGGPVGAAAGLALQAILRNALGEAAEARYSIRGPWDDPVIETLGRGPKSENAGKDPAEERPAEAPPATEQNPGTGDTGTKPSDGSDL